MGCSSYTFQYVILIACWHALKLGGAWELVRTVLKLPWSLDQGYCNVVAMAGVAQVLAKMGPLLSIEALLR